VEEEEAVVIRQRHGKQVSAAANKHAITVVANFEISTPQFSIYYTHDGRGDVLNIVVCQNGQLSEVIFTAIQDSDHLPTIFSNLDSVRTMEALDPVEKLTGSHFKASPLD
jgi:hypothetical protein